MEHNIDRLVEWHYDTLFHGIQTISKTNRKGESIISSDFYRVHYLNGICVESKISEEIAREKLRLLNKRDTIGEYDIVYTDIVSKEEYEKMPDKIKGKIITSTHSSWFKLDEIRAIYLDMLPMKQLWEKLKPYEFLLLMKQAQQKIEMEELN